jgi:hypothetical protein
MDASAESATAPNASDLGPPATLVHLLSPKFLSVRAKPLGEGENRAGRLILFGVIGGIFWLFVFGILYRLLRYFRGIPEIGALLAAKLLGLMLVSLLGILILSNIVTALSSFFLAKDLDTLVPPWTGCGCTARSWWRRRRTQAGWWCCWPRRFSPLTDSATTVDFYIR